MRLASDGEPRSEKKPHWKQLLAQERVSRTKVFGLHDEIRFLMLRARYFCFFFFAMFVAHIHWGTRNRLDQGSLLWNIVS